MTKNIFIKIIFAVLLAFTVNTFVYFGFGNIYSSKILDYKDFYYQFNNGVYQHRVLSGFLLLEIYHFLESLNLDYSIFKLKFFNITSEPQMYISFYVLNTVFTILSSIIMVLIGENKNFTFTNSEKILVTSVGIFAIAVTQFVILPYDCSSYFFILLFFLMLLQYLDNKNKSILVSLILILALSTINRESSALSLSLAATLFWEKFGFKKESYLNILLLVFTFLVAYFGVRFLHKSFNTNDGNLFTKNFYEAKNILGILFWLVFLSFTVLISKSTRNRNLIFTFHLLSLPYILMCFYTGILYEVRLYIPLFLTSLYLAFYKGEFYEKYEKTIAS